MNIPLDIAIRGIRPSEAVEAKVRRRASGLERYSKRISRCEVWIEADRAHHRKGPVYGARIRLTVPEEEIVVDLQPEEEDVFAAIRLAFDAARRRLQDYERRWPGRLRGRPQSRRRPRPAANSAGSASGAGDAGA